MTGTEKIPKKGADMYAENNRRSAARRADDEFLRRMAGGDLIGNGFPVISLSEPQTQSAVKRFYVGL